MKEKILRALHSAGDRYVSGAWLCEQFGVSRQAVWKNIVSLKENGFEIESVTKKGYRLSAVPDKLYAPDILSRLPQNCICRKAECFQTIDSTNTKAKQLAEFGEAEGTLVTAEEQTAGKGRRGRNWESEPGVGIWMTLLLRPTLLPVRVSALTLLAALALVRAVKEVCRIDAEIKWPNDVIVAKKKICGILTEMSSEENYVHYVVVGIGINANTTSFSKEVEETATSLYLQTGRKTDRAALTAAWVEKFCNYYEEFLKIQDLSFVIDEYNQVLANRDKEVRVYYGMYRQASLEGTEVGVAKGIDSDGALLVEIGGQVKRIVSGEVSVRGLHGYV